MRPDIFRKRINVKPYEYPELQEFVDAIRHSYWVHTEYNYKSDIQDMKVNMPPEHVEIVKRTMLAISQIEANVKEFWGNIGNIMPKPEVKVVGATFNESEARHMDAYSHLIEIMGLNEEFERVVEVPEIARRIDYMNDSMQKYSSNKGAFMNVILFSMFVENVSLTAQFLILMAFNKYKNQLKGISNAVEATSKEEDIHAKFGFAIVNIIRKENPEWFDEDTTKEVLRLCDKAYRAEMGIVDWIYGDADLDFLPKDTVKEFLKGRFNKSLQAIDMPKMYEVDEEILEQTEWFEDELTLTKNTDFFYKRSTAYTKKTVSTTEDDLF